MRDIDIRKRLHERLRKVHPQAENRIVDELGLCLGVARIDLALINGMLHGFEIKSEKDTLKRLPEQIVVYNKIFDRVTLVSSAKHIEKVYDIVPRWWGLMEARQSKRSTSAVITTIRPATPNSSVEPRAVVQLLWRKEVLEELVKIGAAKGILSKPNTTVVS